MRINRRKFAFIICVNEEHLFRECELYINQLNIPSGFTVEIVPIRNVDSMAQGYNRGMASTDAKYKIYMHQDVFIINPNFLNDVLTVFKHNWKIAMIGIMGNPTMPPSGVMWQGERIGNLYQLEPDNVNFNGYEYKKEDGFTEVEAIDGLLMVTREDIAWREDLFDGWSFSDCAQCYEFRQKGYKIVVPEQKKPWVAHDNGIINVWGGYDKYRKIFTKHYMSGGI